MPRRVTPGVTVEARRRGVCPVCGGRTVLVREFTQTMSPFNLDAHGRIRTMREVRAAVQAEAAGWDPDFTHAACALLAQGKESP